MMIGLIVASMSSVLVSVCSSARSTSKRSIAIAFSSSPRIVSAPAFWTTSAGSSGSIRRAAPAHVSGNAALSAATTGVPQAIASRHGSPKPS